MRLALIFAASALLAACAEKAETAGPERGSAAGEVLGGEVTDEMLPLDTVRSTSPADQSAGRATDRAPSDEAPRPAPSERATVLPSPEVRGGPEPYVEPSEVPPQ